MIDAGRHTDGVGIDVTSDHALQQLAALGIADMHEHRAQHRPHALRVWMICRSPRATKRSPTPCGPSVPEPSPARRGEGLPALNCTRQVKIQLGPADAGRTPWPKPVSARRSSNAASGAFADAARLVRSLDSTWLPGSARDRARGCRLRFGIRLDDGADRRRHDLILIHLQAGLRQLRRRRIRTEAVRRCSPRFRPADTAPAQSSRFTAMVLSSKWLPSLSPLNI